MRGRTGIIGAEDANTPLRSEYSAGGVVCDQGMSEPRGQRDHRGDGSSGSGRGNGYGIPHSA